MSLIVQKYGGVCLATPEKVRQVAAHIAEQHRVGHNLIVIVSAMGQTTDDLVRLAYQVSAQPNRRELDMLLSTGERVSMSLLSMALADLGCPSISFTGSQAGVMTDSAHSNARIVDVRPIRLREELAKGRVIVLAGFQGVDPKTKEITTLGRGGSDTTAVAMAAHFQALRCEIIKEVDGICSADPKIVPHAKTYPQLPMAALLDMCFWGAKVLHYRSVELAHFKNVPLVVRRWGQNSATTILNEVTQMEQQRILAINSHRQVEHIAAAAESQSHGFALLTDHLQSHRLPWPQILASTYENGQARWMITADAEALSALIASLTSPLSRLRESLASVSATCAGAVGTPLLADMVRQLAEEKILVEKTLVSPLTATVFVAPTQREQAVQVLHNFLVN